MAKKRSHRRNYRQQSHQESHANGEITPVLQGNPLVPTEEAQWIDTNDGVVAICEELKASKIFTFDTEFIGEDSYFAKTCLIQVGTAETVALIDPFAADNLTPLYTLLCDPECTKVVHAGKQDFEPVMRLFGKPPANVFDTQLAAGLIGFPWPIALTKLIEVLLQHDVGGHFTLTQWDARPLTKRQKFYAADDVRYLLAIHDIIQKKLDTLGRLEWVEEECQSLTSPSEFGFDLQTTVKRICKNKTPRKKELLRIQSLVTLRDSIAQQENEPPRSVIPDDCLIAIARKPSDTPEQLASLKGFPKNIAMRFGKNILQSIVDAQDLTPLTLRKPNPIEKEANTRQELDGLWSLFCAWCVGNELSSNLVASRATFTDWCLAVRADTQPPSSPLTTGWRSQVMQPFSAFMQGEEELQFSRDNTFIAKVKK
ncbi:MAG: HRDC domain-containing protein [Planctomycetes bacterium]|nr:HRDC domain-containing protein [Planctomycetota bacterium]